MDLDTTTLRSAHPHTEEAVPNPIGLSGLSQFSFLQLLLMPPRRILAAEGQSNIVFFF